MIAFITLCYCVFIWLLFFKIKIAPFDTKAKIIVTSIGLVVILGLLFTMNICQPYSTDLLVYQPVARIGARVAGRVLEVPVLANVPIQKGTVLFKIDPVPYQHEVTRLKAAIAEAEQAVPQLKATWQQTLAKEEGLKLDTERLAQAVQTSAVSQSDYDATRLSYEAAQAETQRAYLAYTSQINGENTTVAQLRAQLAQAEWNLEETVVYAPADGKITQLGLAPGSIVGQAAASSQIPFVYNQRAFIATFQQSTRRYIEPGDQIDMAFDTLPGKVFSGSVESVMPATGQGQLSPSGDMIARIRPQFRGRFFVRLVADFNDLPESQIPTAGTGGAVAIYTDKAKAIRIVRKVIVRMYTWLNFIMVGT